jgi:hypothetical protein
MSIDIGAAMVFHSGPDVRTAREGPMATKIHVERAHKLGLEEACKRGHEMVERFREKLSGWVSEVKWSPDGRKGTASGKLFDALFDISETKVAVDIELKGLGAMVMKGQIQGQIEKSLEKRFV